MKNEQKIGLLKVEVKKWTKTGLCTSIRYTCELIKLKIGFLSTMAFHKQISFIAITYHYFIVFSSTVLYQSTSAAKSTHTCKQISFIAITYHYFIVFISTVSYQSTSTTSLLQRVHTLVNRSHSLQSHTITSLFLFLLQSTSTTSLLQRVHTLVNRSHSVQSHTVTSFF